MSEDWEVRRKEAVERARVSSGFAHEAKAAYKEASSHAVMSASERVVSEHPSAPRNYSYNHLTGPREDVLLVVGNILTNARCTQCYEHMLPQVCEVTISDGGSVSVLISTNLYAGD